MLTVLHVFRTARCLLEVWLDMYSVSLDFFLRPPSVTGTAATCCRNFFCHFLSALQSKARSSAHHLAKKSILCLFIVSSEGIPQQQKSSSSNTTSFCFDFQDSHGLFLLPALFKWNKVRLPDGCAGFWGITIWITMT